MWSYIRRQSILFLISATRNCHEKIFFNVVLDIDLIFIPALNVILDFGTVKNGVSETFVFPQPAAQFNPLTHKEKGISIIVFHFSISIRNGM